MGPRAGQVWAIPVLPLLSMACLCEGSVMQVTVVGTGPAGLMAAEVLASGGAQVRLVDHKPQPSRKFLLAGRGGLNLTHSEPLDQLLTRYGACKDWLEPAIRAFPPAAVRAWCHGLGVETFVGSSGRVFPVGLKASPLLRAWLRRLEALGVVLTRNTRWEAFDDGLTVLALGGASWPELGSDARWIAVFENAGVRVNPLLPANSRQAIAWSSHFRERFAGEPIKNVAFHAVGQKSRGELMIAKDGLEGGAVYALSSQLREPRQVTIDLKPDLSPQEVATRMARPRGKQSRSSFLRKNFNLAPAAIALMREAGSDDPKNVPLMLQGPAGIARAISSAGGVARDEVDSDFQLVKVPGTYVVGEMLDWEAPTGGYLLQACFATARWAATAMLRDHGQKP